MQLLDLIGKDAEEMCKAERMGREGKLPKRVCHCDTKVNNMMFDEEGHVLCVIDLDTVMPSFVFSDYGDFLRSAANTTAEDDPDMSHVAFNEEIFKAFTRGYIEGARFLTPMETENLPYAVALFPSCKACASCGTISAATTTGNASTRSITSTARATRCGSTNA